VAGFEAFYDVPKLFCELFCRKEDAANGYTKRTRIKELKVKNDLGRASFSPFRLRSLQHLQTLISKDPKGSSSSSITPFRTSQ